MKNFLKAMFIVEVAVFVIFVFQSVTTNKKVIRSWPENQDHGLPPIEIIIMNDLMEKNNLEIINLKAYRLLGDEFGMTHIKFIQLYENLPIFTSDIIYHFDKNGKYVSTSGKFVSEIDVLTIPAITKSKAKKIALKEIKKQESSEGIFVLEGSLGLYDKNISRGTNVNDFVLVWEMKTVGAGYPVVYIDALTSKIIYFDGGLRFK